MLNIGYWIYGGSMNSLPQVQNLREGYKALFLQIKLDINDVAILHNIGFALLAQFASRAGLGQAAQRN